MLAIRTALAGDGGTAPVLLHETASAGPATWQRAARSAERAADAGGLAAEVLAALVREQAPRTSS